MATPLLSAQLGGSGTRWRQPTSPSWFVCVADAFRTFCLSLPPQLNQAIKRLQQDVLSCWNRQYYMLAACSMMLQSHPAEAGNISLTAHHARPTVCSETVATAAKRCFIHRLGKKKLHSITVCVFVHVCIRACVSVCVNDEKQTLVSVKL